MSRRTLHSKGHGWSSHRGEWSLAEVLQGREVFAEYEHVLALDGAAIRMVDAGIVPTAIIGDLDSVDNTTLEHCKANGSLVIHTPNQEQSDVAKGLHWAEKTYPNEQIDLIGIELGRYDHNLAAYSALFECNTSARILMDGWSALRVNSIPNHIRYERCDCKPHTFWKRNRCIAARL